MRALTLLRRLGLALKFHRELNYTWHLAWVKAGGR